MTLMLRLVDAMILAGDIGGTSTRLALFQSSGDALQAVAAGATPAGATRAFPRSSACSQRRIPEPIEAAAFGIAGPVRDGRVETPNLPWVIEAAALRAQLNVPRVSLLNDLEANAWGVFTLGADDVATLSPGAPRAMGTRRSSPPGPALARPGASRTNRGCCPSHRRVATRISRRYDELTIELFRWLHRRHGHVSWERVVSGPGLVNIFTFLHETKHGELSAELGGSDA